MKHSGELCFIDSSGNMDRENCRVFLLLTHSCAGGLPLGILLCQSEDEQTIAQGLEQLKQVVGEKGFAGRGHEGPQLVITDDCRAERGALRKAFPKATLLLCSFHLLQAVWRWLWSKESCCTQEKVHQLKHSGELCFIDSSGNMDRENCRVFLLLTHSCAGGLPLGILLCQSEDEQTIAQGLEQLKQVVGEKGFAGRGHEGPQLVITDDCRAERGALRKAFPKATLLLCSFHLLQAVWRWLWSKESCCTQEVRRWLKTAFIFWAPCYLNVARMPTSAMNSDKSFTFSTFGRFADGRGQMFQFGESNLWRFTKYRTNTTSVSVPVRWRREAGSLRIWNQSASPIGRHKLDSPKRKVGPEGPRFDPQLWQS
ncbi:hypothetical protein F7725_008818 [Dissostichus mawsoni]|uniref:MULE transposase domain-containing protein n=1 Tax=Dissostichus mawsoni TaxID=36200 RepID=A0A7J5Z783_DISMA|nr:hypothetical protein F7725_008818 [Dissostichus mawsoni]